MMGKFFNGGWRATHNKRLQRSSAASRRIGESLVTLHENLNYLK